MKSRLISVRTDSGHLNVRGAEKVSTYLAEYLAAHYELPDHRGDEAYASWERSARHFEALVRLSGSVDVMDALDAAIDPNLLTVILSGGAGEPVELPEEVRGVMASLGLADVPESACEGGYYAVIKDGKVLMEKRFASGVRNDEFMVKDTRFALQVSAREPDGGSYMTALHIDSGGYFSFEPGMVIITFDADRMEPVTAIRYAFDETLSVVHL